MRHVRLSVALSAVIKVNRLTMADTSVDIQTKVKGQTHLNMYHGHWKKKWMILIWILEAWNKKEGHLPTPAAESSRTCTEVLGLLIVSMVFCSPFHVYTLIDLQFFIQLLVEKKH